VRADRGADRDPASTSTLAQAEAMRSLGTTRFGLAVPYRDDVTARIVEVYADEGLEAVAVANARIETNREMAHVSADEVRALVRAADHPDAECIAVICTGMAAAHLVPELEHELGKPIVDSIAVVLWKALAMVGIDRARLGRTACRIARPVRRGRPAGRAGELHTVTDRRDRAMRRSLAVLLLAVCPFGVLACGSTKKDASSSSTTSRATP
jgi:hypothetical protein